MTPTDTDTPRAALDRLRARRRAAPDAFKGWPPETPGCAGWRAKMDDLRDVNRTPDLVPGQLEG
jgi:hypothetical protein